MIVAVLDTNVLASGSTHQKGHSGQLVTAWRRGAFVLVVSEHILEELAETLEDRYFKKRLSKQRRRTAVARIRRQAHVTKITASVSGIAPDEADDLVLATAESAGAAFVVSGDGPFLEVGQYHGIRILSPAAFLALLDTDANHHS